MIAALLLLAMLTGFSFVLGVELESASRRNSGVRRYWWMTESVLVSGMFALCCLALLLYLFAQARP